MSQTESNETTEAVDNFNQDQEKSGTPAFDLVRISRGGTGVIAGRMSPGAHVELFANGKKIAEVTADKNGEWVMILEEPLEAGSVELNLKAKASDSDTVIEADNVVVVSVPERESDRFLAREQNGVVAVLTPKDGQGGSTVLQKPGVAAYAEVGESLSLDTVDFGEGGVPVFTGRSLPRVEVRVYLDDVFIGSSRADDAGRWSVSLSEDQELTTGSHVARLDQTIGDGKVQLRIEQPFETGEPIDLSMAKGGVFVRPGNTLWQIARQLYGSGVRYTLIFKENSEQIKDPDLIYPGQMFELPKKK
ncbi:LysM peptidoglycan-binding domain-containing protein [Kordiimonas pumila]|uniref:LysM peptidoglycan-binding domain-containing protein n=1 Tax=Kordiimonas pumila TaxID=2161677 RepID=UPI001D16AE09|nr:LysM peptidoglycan-binding domain-containing protein [Kordiimonas pumila]